MPRPFDGGAILDKPRDARRIGRRKNEPPQAASEPRATQRNAIHFCLRLRRVCV
jgi:hypothetical protein